MFGVRCVIYGSDVGVGEMPPTLAVFCTSGTWTMRVLGLRCPAQNFVGGGALGWVLQLLRGHFIGLS
jgi:hypothetical protein